MYVTCTFTSVRQVLCIRFISLVFSRDSIRMTYVALYVGPCTTSVQFCEAKPVQCECVVHKYIHFGNHPMYFFSYTAAPGDGARDAPKARPARGAWCGHVTGVAGVPTSPRPGKQNLKVLCGTSIINCCFYSQCLLGWHCF